MKKDHCRVWHLTTWVLVKRLSAKQSWLPLYNPSPNINGFCLRKALKHQPIVSLPARHLFPFERFAVGSLS
jgi:hypothetical protein